jgi:hypothetical protein
VVPCHRLDDVLPWASQRVGLLHLDVERHESEVVDGARAPRSHLEVDTHILASEGLLLQVRRGQGEQAGQETPSTRGRWLNTNSKANKFPSKKSAALQAFENNRN